MAKNKKKMKISKSIKTYIRREKEKIRRNGAVGEERQDLVKKLYERVGGVK